MQPTTFPKPPAPTLTVAAGFQRIKDVGPAVVVTFTGFRTEAEAKDLARIMQDVAAQMVAALRAQPRAPEAYASANTPAGVLTVSASLVSDEPAEPAEKNTHGWEE